MPEVSSQPSALPPRHPVRDRWREIIFEAETPAGRAFDVILLWMIGLSVLVVMLESIASIREHHADVLHFAEWFFTVAFTIEYGLRIWTTRR